MPDLTEESTPPTVATPPVINPADFESFPTFRETFALWFTDPGANRTLRAFGELLHDFVLEYAHLWPNPDESWTRLQLRAVVADMRHLQGALAEMAEDAPGGTAPDMQLCAFGGKIGADLGKLADRIEEELGPWRG